MYVAKSDAQVAQRIEWITDEIVDPHEAYIRIKALIKFSKWNKTHDIRTCGIRQLMLLMYESPYSKDILDMLKELVWFMGWDNYFKIQHFDPELVLEIGPGIVV